MRKQQYLLLPMVAVAAICCLLFAPSAAFASGGFYFGSTSSAIPVGSYEDVEDELVETDNARFYYTGNQIKPDVYLYSDAYGWIENVSYLNNINVGTAKAIVEWKRWEYGYDENGTLVENVIPEETVLYFKIEKETLNRNYFDFASGTSTYAYTGKAVKPKITSDDLTYGKDYAIKYKNNVKVGTAQIEVTGKGLYQGAVTLKFKIKRLTKVTLSNAYNGAKRISGKVSNVVKGDVIKLKIGKKVYSKKVKKSAKSLKYTFKVPRQSYGKKYTVTVCDKNKKKVTSKKGTIWYSNKLKLGQTKRQVKLNPNWGSPSYVNKSRYYETWVYDEYDYEDNWIGSSYLYFRGGRLDSWIL